MKIAVCFSGHIRTFEKTINSLQICLADHDVDYFVHSWTNFGNSASWCYPIDESQTVPDGFIQKFITPVSCVLENKDDVDLTYDGPKTFRPWPLHDQFRTDRVLGMFYTMWAADQLRQEHEKKTGVKYDAVIRTRMDLCVFRCDVPAVSKYFDDNTVVLSSQDESLHAEIMNAGVLPDKIAVASPAAMTKFCSHWPHLRDYIREGAYFHGEGLLYYHVVQKQQLKTILVPDIYGRIIRG